MADLTVSPESLRAAGRQFGQLADRLNTEWTSFASQVQAMGDDVAGIDRALGDIAELPRISRIGFAAVFVRESVGAVD